MSSSQVFPTLPGTIDPLTMCGDNPPGLVSTEWYTPTTTFAFPDQSYITPYPSSTIESQPWTFARASVPDIHLSHGHYQMHPTPTQHQHSTAQQPMPQAHQQLGSHARDPSRPRSSPSTFGPSPDSIAWTSAGLGISTYTSAGQPTPVTSTFPPAVFTAFAKDEHYSTPSPPEIRQPQPRRPYASIAPNPEGVAAVKREREDDERQEATMRGGKRRKRTTSLASTDLSEDDQFLVQLKEDENLPWKDIAARFASDKNKPMQVAALQMRYKRLREKFREWTEKDVSALKLAYEYWEKYKWEIIATKMMDFDVQERWPPRYCARKWQGFEPVVTGAQVTTAGMTPATFAHFSSPIEAPAQFGLVPLQ